MLFFFYFFFLCGETPQKKYLLAAVSKYPTTANLEHPAQYSRYPRPLYGISITHPGFSVNISKHGKRGFQFHSSLIQVWTTPIQGSQNLVVEI